MAWKLLWAGNSLQPSTDIGTFSKYSGSEVEDVQCRFPRILMPDGKKELIGYKVLFKELRNIDSVVEGTEKLMKTFLHSIANGKLDYTTEDQFKESLKRIKGSICIVKGVHSESSDEETELEPSRSKKRKAVISERIFTDEECGKLGYILVKLQQYHNAMCATYYNDEVKHFLYWLIQICTYDNSNISTEWMSTTNNPNQHIALSTIAEHELMGTTVDLHGVPDVGMCKITADNHEEIILLAEVNVVFWFLVKLKNLQGKSSADEDTGLFGLGQLVVAMLTAYVRDQGRNSIVGFTLSPTKISVYDMPKMVAQENIRLRSYGSVDHSTNNIKDLLVLIGYIRLATQQHSRVFKYDNYQDWCDQIK